MRRMTKPAMEDLTPFAIQIARLRYRAVRDRLGDSEFEIWSFAHITELRAQAELSKRCEAITRTYSQGNPRRFTRLQSYRFCPIDVTLQTQTCH